ncbi:MAG: anaerobic ribonucleoside-triphosphate reductase activating protein [Candidatus Caldatribacteriaceae bacterium]
MPVIFRGWHKVSYIEYPGKIATVLFVGGCHFRCPYCHNPEMVQESPQLPQVSEEEVLSFLEKRKGLIDAVCITGGEPLLKPDLPRFIKKVKEKGYLVKVDSNGSSWKTFQALRGMVDRWGLDYKLPFSQYHMVGGEKWAQEVERVMAELLENPEHLEVRTTIFPPFHSLPVLLTMAENLKKAHSWYWQNFRADKTLSQEAKRVPPYSREVLLEWQARVNETMHRELVIIRP